MRFRGVIWLAMPLGWISACGGLVERNFSDGAAPGAGTSPSNGVVTSGTDTSTSGGVAISNGGSTSGAGSSSSAGRSSGGAAGHAGSSSVSGGVAAGGRSVGSGGTTAGVGGACVCDEVECEPPNRLEPNVDGCCSHCEAPCSGRGLSYGLFHASVLSEAQARPCVVDSECAHFVDNNACGYNGFCPVGLRKDDLANVEQLFETYAQNHCVGLCPTEGAPAYCPPDSPPRCLQGRCQ